MMHIASFYIRIPKRMFQSLVLCRPTNTVRRVSRLHAPSKLLQQTYQHRIIPINPASINGVLCNCPCINHSSCLVHSGRSSPPPDKSFTPYSKHHIFPLISSCCLLRMLGQHHKVFFHSNYNFCSSAANLPNEDEFEGAADHFTDRRLKKAENITEELLNELRKLERETPGSVTVEGLVEEHVAGIISLMLAHKVSPRQILEALIKLPKLLKEPVSRWVKALTAFKDLGFESSQYMAAIMDFPEVFRGKQDVLSRCFDTLRAIGFRDRQLHKILLGNPGIVDVSSKSLIRHHNQLLTLFTRSDLARIILSDPTIFTTPFSETKAKVQYVCDLMNIDMKSALKTNFVQHDLIHIETRHQFLFRAGLYETPNKHGVTKRIQNPTLKNIVDTEDRYFAVKVAGLTKAEYQTFQKLYVLEKERNADIDSSSDFSDSSDDEF